MKGYYSAVIGVLTLMVLATALFTVYSFNKSQSLIPQKESFGYTIKEWQNTRRLLDKAASDAIIDKAFSLSCLREEAGFYNNAIKSQVIFYTNNVISGISTECSVKNINVNRGDMTFSEDPGKWERHIYDVNVSFNLECRHRLEVGKDLNSLAAYSRDVLFEKTVDGNHGFVIDDCNIFITDKQSDLIEAEFYIVP